MALRGRRIHNMRNDLPTWKGESLMKLYETIKWMLPVAAELSGRNAFIQSVCRRAFVNVQRVKKPARIADWFF